MARRSVQGDEYRKETFDNCPISNIKKGCTSYVHCHIDGYTSCPIYFKHEIKKIKNKILSQTGSIEKKVNLAKISITELIETCGRPAYKQELLGFAEECLSEITQGETKQ